MASRLTKSLCSSYKPTQFNLTSRTISPLSRTIFRINILQFHTTTKTMAEQTSSYRANGDNGDDGSTEGEFNQWKHRAPYKVHDNDPNFHARYEASCHCGKIRYQLSREKPLDAKYCHCTTCQKLHGTEYPPGSSVQQVYAHPLLSRSTIPVGCYLPQRRHQFHPRSPRPGLVRKFRKDYRAQAALQSQLRILPYTYHG